MVNGELIEADLCFVDRSPLSLVHLLGMEIHQFQVQRCAARVCFVLQSAFRVI